MNSEEIARLANVSRSTVSRVLNQYDNVPDSTRKKVQAIIDEYGYTPNHSARILAGKANNIIGIFLADISEGVEESKRVGVNSPYNTEMLAHFITYAKKQGYLTLVHTITDLKECKEMESYFANRMIYGGIFIGFPYRTSEIEDMAHKAYNVVLVDQLSDLDDPEGLIKRVNTQNIEAGYMATKYLLDHGHSKILHMSGDDRISAYEREKGYKQAMKEAGNNDIRVISGLYLESKAYKQTKKYFRQIEEKDRPTAIFAANDIMALGVAKALEELNLKVPQDISIIGFDNLQWADWIDLQLTTVDPGKQDLAECSIRMLLDKKNSGVSEPVIIERKSVIRI